MIELTIDLLRATYDLLNLTTPFDKWNLPDGEDIEFRVIKDKTCFGYYNVENSKHVIAISNAKNGHLNTIQMSMAHEMVHMIQHRNCTLTSNHHDRAFRRLAKEVCDIHGWDLKMF